MLPSFSHPCHPQNPKEPNFYFLELLLSLKRYWWILLASVLTGFFGAFSYLEYTPKIYIARVSYEVFDLNPVNLQQKHDEGRTVDLENEFLNQHAIGLLPKLSFLRFFLTSLG